VTVDPYELVVAGPAARAIAEQLPEAVSAAVIDFITGALIENPHRVGRALRNELAGIHSARRGTYRVLYRIDDELREVTVLRVDHRGSAYRSRRTAIRQHRDRQGRSRPTSSVAVLAGWPCTDVGAFAVLTEQAQDLHRPVTGGTEPVRYLRVELGDLTGHHRDVMASEHQAEFTAEHVQPFVALV
jgi:mRNA-degrading endonuclease RelE of RelBE toxin-antitoxin system